MEAPVATRALISMPEFREYPKAIYKGGNPDNESMSVKDANAEKEAAESGFFAIGAFQPATAQANINEELQTEEAATEEEVIEPEPIPTDDADDEKAALRAQYLERFGKAAPGRMGVDKLKEALAAS